MPANASWAARLVADDGRVTLTFTSPVRTIGLTADGARRLAAKLLLLAESAENEHSRFRDREVPHGGDEIVADLPEPQSCRSGCSRPATLAGLCDACVHAGGSDVSA